MKIVSLNRGNFGKEIVLPFDGKKLIGEDGSVDVTPNCADHLVKNNPNWAYEGQAEEKKKALFEESVPEPVGDEKALKAQVRSLEAEVKELQSDNARLNDLNTELNKRLTIVSESQDVAENAAPVATKVANVSGAEEAEAEVAVSESDSEDEKAKLEGTVAAMKKNELKELCQTAGYPESEWVELAVAPLREYVISKALSK